jgi:TonB-dependent SusC/RagA subfamily outer membrane receptor
MQALCGAEQLWRSGRRCGMVLGVLFLVGAAQARAQTGTVVGRVTDERTSQPVAGATLEIQGSRLTAVADADGRYRIAGVAAGPRTIVARRLGYASARQSVAVSLDGQATADFALRTAAMSLDAVVVTGTAGVEELRSIGNAVSTIDASKALSLSAAPTLGTLLNARSPGVVISTGTGRVGTGPAINIRGRSSIGLSNSPLIYVDGVRLDNSVGTGPGGTGGFSTQNSQVGGRLNDITPEDIDRIEIIKGPAASTIYGTEASNGVIQIITKKGTLGAKPQFTLQAQTGNSWFRDAEGRIPTNFAQCSAAAVLVTSLTPECHGKAVGDVVTWNGVQAEKARGRPLFKSGGSSLVNGSISGGRNDVRYYVSSAYERANGIEPNNGLQQFSTHANLDLAITPKLNMSTSLNYLDLRSRLGVDAGASAMLGAVFGHTAVFPTSR